MTINKRLENLEKSLEHEKQEFYTHVLKPVLGSIPEFQMLICIQILRDLEQFLAGGELAKYLSDFSHDEAKAASQDLRAEYPDADSVDLIELELIAIEKTDKLLTNAETQKAQRLGWFD